MTEKVPVSCSIRPQEISGGFTAKPRKPRKHSSSTTRRDRQRHGDDDVAHHVGQDVLDDDAPVGGADRDGRADIFDAGQRQRLAAHLAADSCAQPSAAMTTMTKARKTLDGAVTGISEVSAR